jgi:hypothetical protein
MWQGRRMSVDEALELAETVARRIAGRAAAGGAKIG